MIKTVKFILFLCLTQAGVASTIDQYNSAKKQYILEYTVFGVDECLKSNLSKLVVDDDALETDQILVGSKEYFLMFEDCFKHLKNKCEGDKCIVYNSMNKRLENVRYVDQMKKKLKALKQ